MVAAGPPADLIRGFATPYPYAVICDMLGVPMCDLDGLLPWVSAMMSAGAFSADEVAAAHQGMHQYFSDAIEQRRADGLRGHDLLTALLSAPAGSRLSDEEIAVFGLGLMMAGGETTSNFLACCIVELLQQPALMATLTHDPGLIPSAVDEFLRWIWFGGTGGQPHVVLADVRLGTVALGRGQVVIPLVEAANRDPSAFPDVDEFKPDRSPNPHVGLGHGRHLCLGAAHARVELEIALAALLRRFDGLSLATDELKWRDKMFMRGVWELPVSWRTR
jgi:cytochrome P450